MPVARNMMQLNNMLMRELKSTMKKVRKKSKEDMKEATKWFYDGGEPEMYVRTGALGDTPKVTYNNSYTYSNGGEVSFTAYLDKSHVYTTGDRPDMEKVLDLANDGIQWVTANGYYARNTVGNKKFWERAEENIEKDFESTLSKTFTLL